jgi:hypothetical protein
MGTVSSPETSVTKHPLALISVLRRDVDEICDLLGNYTASCGNYLPTFRDNIFFPLGILTREDGTDTLSRNVGK